MWEHELASLVSVNRHATHSTIMHSQKKDASSPELSHTIFPICSNVNSHIMTEIVLERKCCLAPGMIDCVAYLLTDTSDAGSRSNDAGSRSRRRFKHQEKFFQ